MRVGVLSATLGAMKVWVLPYVGDWPVIWEVLTERERKSRLAALQVVSVRSHCRDFTLVKSINLKTHYR